MSVGQKKAAPIIDAATSSYGSGQAVVGERR